MLIKHYFKLGFRHFKKNKGNTLVNISGLSLGISILLVIAIYATNELSIDRFHEEFSNIYKVSAGNSSGTPGPLSELLKSTFPEIKEATHIETRQLNAMSPMLSFNNEPYEISGYYSIDSVFFNVFDFPVLQGDLSKALTVPFSMILTESEAARIFKGKNPIGEQVTWKAIQDFTFTIQAIVKDVPQNSSIQFKGLISDASVRKMTPYYPDNWGFDIYETYMVLNQNVELEIFENKARSFLISYYETRLTTLSSSDHARLNPLHLHTLKDAYFNKNLLHDTTGRGNLFLIRVLIAIGIIILLLSFINYINLSTARASLRRKEIGLQKIFGSAKKQLVFQYLTETIMISFISAIIAVIIGIIILPEFCSFIGIGQVLKFPYAYLLLLFPGVIVLGTVAGIYPAFFISSRREIHMLKSETEPQSRGNVLRYALLIFQFSISIILIAFTILINKQVTFIKNQDTGISKEHVIFARLPHQIFRNGKEVLTERLLNIPDIRNISFTSQVIGRMNENNSLEVKGGTIDLTTIWVDDEFVNLYDLKLLEGRLFTRELRSDINATAVLNEAAVRELGDEDPYSVEIKVPGGQAKVVGIVKDFNYLSLHHTIEPLAIIYLPGQGIYANIKLYGNNVQKSLDEIEKIWEELAPGFPFSYDYLEASFNDSYKNDDRMGRAITYASAIAIIIAIMGVLSLSLLLCQSREKEIGIRKINGANEWQVILWLNKGFIRKLLIAFIFACPLAWFIMAKWLDNFAYKTSISLWVFLFSGCVVATITITIVSLQSRRFALQNPADTLRNE